ncbi:hypothetical protein DH86_00003219, partial [Scytalidium sp. 3C]
MRRHSRRTPINVNSELGPDSPAKISRLRGRERSSRCTTSSSPPPALAARHGNVHNIEPGREHDSDYHLATSRIVNTSSFWACVQFDMRH